MKMEVKADHFSTNYFCTVKTKEEVNQVRSLIRARLANGDMINGFTKDDKVKIQAQARGPRGKGYYGGDAGYTLHKDATHFDVYVYRRSDYRY